MEIAMPIKEQRVTIGFTDKNGQTVLVLLRDDSQRLNCVQWPLHRLEPEGYHALCQHLGDTALRMLAIAHPDEFAHYPRLTPPPQETDDPHGLVHALIARSYKERTTAYIAVIDRLIEQNAAALRETELPETWKEARLQLIEVFPPSPAT